MRKTFGLILIAGLLALAGFFTYKLFSPVGSLAGAEVFAVGPEASKVEVSRSLKLNDYIRSTIGFILLHSVNAGLDGVEAGGYEIDSSMSALEISDVLDRGPAYRWLHLGEGLSRSDIAGHLGEIFAWDERDKGQFVITYNAMMWDFYNEQAIAVFSDMFNWGVAEREAFATMASFYADPKYGFFEGMYMPGDYLIALDDSKAQVAEALISPLRELSSSEAKEFLETNMNIQTAENVSELVIEGVELLPDLLPLPALDVGMEYTGGRDLLVFTTTYWNQGEGPLELIADPATRGISGDINRDIYQRIYRTDGDFRDKLAGNFAWHETHLHYHYDDFVNYILEGIDADYNKPAISKATFCVRDVEDVDSRGTYGAVDTASYSICGKERQGISVGWGDSYYFTYADQNIDITGMPAGTYKLSFHVNPKGRFEELKTDNNISSVIIYMNAEEGVVEVLDSIYAE